MPEELYEAWLRLLLVKSIIHQQTNDHIAEPLFTGSWAWPDFSACATEGCRLTPPLNNLCPIRLLYSLRLPLSWKPTCMTGHSSLTPDAKDCPRAHGETSWDDILAGVCVWRTASHRWHDSGWPDGPVTPGEVCNTDDSWRNLFSGSLCLKRLLQHWNNSVWDRVCVCVGGYI